MFGLFKANPTKKIQKQLDSKRVEAVDAQRSGDLRKYAALATEIQALEDELMALRQAR